MEDPNCCRLGMFHVHPGRFDSCSGGDRQADLQAVRNSNPGILVFAIVTRNNPKTHPQSLRVGQLKLDFYVMGRDLGNDYHPVAPVVQDAPILRPNSSLLQWIERRGTDAHLDMVTLRAAFPNAKLTVTPVEGGNDLLVTVSEASCTLHALIHPDGTLQVLTGDETSVQGELPGPWNQPELGHFILVTQAMVHARRALLATRGGENTRPTTHHGRHYFPHPLLADQNRLVAEVRAMQERIPDARLKQEGNNIFWLCTIHQHGRSLDLKIEYPFGYPSQPPIVKTVATLNSGAPHYLSGQLLCWVDTHGNASDWNPGRDTAATAAIAAQRWFACYLVWLTLHTWP